jgi:hypothetical protein
MNVRSCLLGAALVIATATITSTVVSQEAKDPPMPAMTPEQQAMMEKWEAFKTPGENHKLLQDKVGTWTGVVKMWEPGQTEPMQSTCTSTLKMIMDGRYLADDTKGDFMGEPFIGHGITGYDNIKKKYCWVWIDNMGTGLMTGEGTYDPATKTLNYVSEMPDVMAGKYVKCRGTERMIDKDHFVSEMYGTGPDGKEFKNMEIAYSRVK